MRINNAWPVAHRFWLWLDLQFHLSKSLLPQPLILQLQQMQIQCLTMNQVWISHLRFLQFPPLKILIGLHFQQTKCLSLRQYNLTIPWMESQIFKILHQVSRNLHKLIIWKLMHLKWSPRCPKALNRSIELIAQMVIIIYATFCRPQTLSIAQSMPQRYFVIYWNMTKITELTPTTWAGRWKSMTKCALYWWTGS